MVHLTGIEASQSVFPLSLSLVIYVRYVIFTNSPVQIRGRKDEGDADGLADGALVGDADARDDGAADGIIEGDDDGLAHRAADGALEGDADGLADGAARERR